MPQKSPQSVPAHPSARWMWIGGTVHLIAAVASLVVGEDLLVATAVGSAGAFLLIEYAARTRALQALCLPIGFVVGNVLVFCYANASYVYLTTLPPGRNHELTAWLTVAMTWACFAGALLMNVVIGSEPEARIRRDSLARSPHAVALAGVMFGVFAAVRIATGYLDARWDLSQRGSFGANYVAGGLNNTMYVFFFLLGVRMQSSLLTPRNVLAVVIALVAAIGNALSGGREFSIWVFALFLLGASVSQLSRKTLAMLTAAAVVFGALLMVAVGAARSRSDFAHSSVDARLTALGEASQEASGTSERAAGSFESVVSRVFEFSAQVVIDQQSGYGSDAGFEHFERLQHAFLPKYLVPDKRDLEDGPEVLQRDFGYRLSEYTSVPITLVADAFRRGGWLWVIAVGLLAGAWLRLVARMTLRVVGPDFGIAALALLALLQFRGYTSSLLGYISLLTYHWVKQVILLLVMIALIRSLVFLTTRATTPRRPGPLRSAEHRAP